MNEVKKIIWQTCWYNKNPVSNNINYKPDASYVLSPGLYSHFLYHGAALW